MNNSRQLTFLFGLIGVSLLSNLTAVLASISTVDFFIPASIQETYSHLINEEDAWTWFFTFYAFPLVAGVIIWYVAPVYSALGRDLKNPLARRRLLDIPIASSLLGALGWILSILPLQLRLAFSPGGYPWEIALWVLRFYGLWIINVFIVTYYLLDFLNRTWFIPWLFEDGRLGTAGRSFRLSIRMRHGILWFTLFLFPALLFLIYLERIQPGSAFSEGPAGLFFGVLAAVTLVLTILVSRSYEASLREMAGAVEQIRQGDLSTRLPLRSSDELGVLAEGLNTMTLDLERSERLKDTFGRVVDPRVRDYLMNHALELGGRTMNAAVLFLDIRGFTAFSEGRRPEEVVAFLNEFFSQMSPIIETHGGTVNKYLGDALMAVFGAPLPLENPQRSALEAALALRRALGRFNEHRPEPVRIGMGLHAGPVTAGNVGSEQRLEFTVIGDTVNTASRLEALAKEKGLDLLVTWATLEAAGALSQARDLGTVVIRGRREAVRIASLEDEA